MATVSTTIPQQIPISNPIPNQQAYNTNKGPYGVDENINLMGQNYNLADKAQFDAYKTKVNNAPNQTSVTPPTQPKSTVQQDLDTATNKYNKASSDEEVAFKKFNDASEAYQNGATPLSSAQQAQIQGLQQQFSQLIDQQKLVNTGAEGTANIRGYQKGTAEYDPTFQTKIIGNIFSAGQSKVADLQSKMANAVAQLTSQFQAENYAGVKGAWDEYQNYAEKAKNEFSSNIKAAQSAISAAQEQQRQAERDNTVATLINNGYKNPSEILQALNSSGANYSAKEIKETIDNLIDTHQYPGGDLGLYEYYYDQEANAGRIPLSLNDWMTLDANRKASIARAGVASSTGGVGGTALAGTLSPLQQQAFDSAQELYKKFTDGKGTSAVGKSNFLGSYGYGLIPGTNRSDFVKQFDNLKSLLSLDNVKYLKGQGAVSDAERQLLADSVSTLDRDQSETEFKKTLGNIISILGGVPQGSMNTQMGSPEQQAKEKVNEIYPQYTQQIDSLLKQNPGITNMEILQIIGH